MYTIFLVPPPIVNVSRETEGEVELTSVQILNCTVTVREVDILVTATLQWTLPASLHNDRKFSVSDTKGEYPLYYSTLAIEDYDYSYSGAYRCTADVLPSLNSSATSHVEKSSSTEVLYLKTSKWVTIC